MHLATRDIFSVRIFSNVHRYVPSIGDLVKPGHKTLKGGINVFNMGCLPWRKVY